MGVNWGGLLTRAPYAVVPACPTMMASTREGRMFHLARGSIVRGEMRRNEKK